MCVTLGVKEQEVYIYYTFNMAAEHGSPSTATPMAWSSYDAGESAPDRLAKWAPAIEGFIEAANARIKVTEKKITDAELAMKAMEKDDAKDEETKKMKEATETAEETTREMKKKMEEMMAEMETRKKEMETTKDGTAEAMRLAEAEADNAQWYSVQAADAMRLIQAMLGRMAVAQQEEEEKMKKMRGERSPEAMRAEGRPDPRGESERSPEAMRAEGRPDPIAGTWGPARTKEAEDGEKAAGEGQGEATGAGYGREAWTGARHGREEAGEREGEERGMRVDPKEASKYWPEPFTGERGSKVFSKHRRGMEVYLTALAPEVDGKKLLDWLGRMAGQPGPVTDEDIAKEVPEDTARTWRKISKTAGLMLHKQTHGAAARKILPIPVGDGFTT